MWDQVVATYGHDTFAYRFLGTYISMSVLYFGYGAFFVLLDLTLSPRAMRKYKSQPKTNEPLDMAKFWQASY
jgi:hypothetical protein